ncbi:hypothetical protein SAMN05421848_1151 [Kushneria avicenniae]|uniref:Uncharacterized protein n=1 Tax=Kushneria avicenniae TaxID=402385 RepID=A0A1I1ICK1_9GAMM|nr:hypothetical protein SAMN05421848_1151 [Kushneria avicenniae]
MGRAFCMVATTPNPFRFPEKRIGTTGGDDGQTTPIKGGNGEEGFYRNLKTTGNSGNSGNTSLEAAPQAGSLVPGKTLKSGNKREHLPV